MTKLSEQTCQACRGDTPALKGEKLRDLHAQVPSWDLVEEHHIEKRYSFDDFQQSLDFVNRVGALAEEQGHHPEIWFTWGQAKLTLRTHKIDGLSEADFILAAKIDELDH